MRSLSNFLLFENVLDNLDSTNPTLNQLANQIFKPNINIVQHNCGTGLGKKITIDLTSNGLVRMDWNGSLNPDLTIPESYRISKSDIQTWLAKSIYTTYVRDLHYCTSVGGVCSCCYAATLNTLAPAIGSIIQIPNQYVTHVDSYITTTSTIYKISASPEIYDNIVVYLDNHPLSSSEYSNGGTYLTLSSSPTYGQFLTIKYIAISNKTFLSYISKTFSGDLLGIEPVAYQESLLPLSVIDRNIQLNQLDEVQQMLQDLGNVDQTYLDYSNTITNKVERGILLLILYTLFKDVAS